MNRMALVTGGNRGIGLAIAAKLAELGNSVLLGSRDIESGESAAAPLRRRTSCTGPANRGPQRD